MTIRVDAYTAGGRASGLMARPGHLRDALEASGELSLERVAWQAIGSLTVSPVGDVTMAADDVLVAVADEEAPGPVHAQWHSIALDLGPYHVDGELPTLPGYDPGRALARPTGEFVLLRDVRLTLEGNTVPGTPIGHHAWVNRYGVDRVRADIMLGFYFPGAIMDGLSEPTGADEPLAVGSSGPPSGRLVS
jgi:hypothetical protein